MFFFALVSKVYFNYLCTVRVLVLIDLIFFMSADKEFKNERIRDFFQAACSLKINSNILTNILTKYPHKISSQH